MMSVQEPTSSSNEEKVLPVSLFESFCQCQVCFMNFNETTKIAMMLHCGHTFCTECIANVQKYGNSAYLECPACRSETKCIFEKIPKNFLVMDMIREIGLMGVADTNPTPKDPKLTRGDQREQTIDEMIDDKYRHVVAEFKRALIMGFDELREKLRNSTIESAQRELNEISESVEDAIRGRNRYSQSSMTSTMISFDGYSDNEIDEYSESEIEEDEIFDEDLVTVIEIPDGEAVGINDDQNRESFIRRHWSAIRGRFSPILDTATTVENPLRSSSSESSDDDESDSDSYFNDDNSTPTMTLTTTLTMMPLATLMTAMAVNSFLKETPNRIL